MILTLCSRSALIDCRLALAKTPGHKKALVKGAMSCNKLKRFDECIEICDSGLLNNPKDQELLDLRAEAVKTKAEAER